MALSVGRPWWVTSSGMRVVAPVESGEASDPDVAVLRRMTAGDEDALAVLWSRHAGSLLSYLIGVLPDRGMAEEVVQDTMLAAWRGAGRFREDSSVRTWLFAIGRRQAMQRLRRRGELSATATDDGGLLAWPALEPGPEATMIARSELHAVSRAVHGLSLIHREVLHLVFAQGLSMQEAAQVLGVPVGTVKSRLSNARRLLAASVAQSGLERP